jgi:hypothetical protein
LLVRHQTHTDFGDGAESALSEEGGEKIETLPFAVDATPDHNDGHRLAAGTPDLSRQAVDVLFRVHNENLDTALFEQPDEIQDRIDSEIPVFAQKSVRLIRTSFRCCWARRARKQQRHKGLHQHCAPFVEFREEADYEQEGAAKSAPENQGPIGP